jgi:hypothetical protein
MSFLEFDFDYVFGLNPKWVWIIWVSFVNCVVSFQDDFWWINISYIPLNFLLCK